MLERLQDLEGRGTELVTVYIPPDKQIHDVMTDLRNEYGTAANIKSKTTRKNVQEALTKAMERLKLFREVPETGLAIFAGKTRAGGQSSRRYERIRQMHLQEYYNRIGDTMTDVFLNVDTLQGIIVGGPGPTKEEFLKGNYLHHEIRDKILTTVDTGYTGHEGVKELVNRSRDFLQKVRYMQERKAVQEFLKHLGEDDGLATYGEDEVLRELKNMNIYMLLVSEKVRRWYVTIECRTCGYKETQIVDMDDWESFQERVENMNCLQCESGQYEIKEREDFIELLVKKAEEAEAKLEVVSTHTEEGEMLHRSFGGVAAITNYRSY